MCSFVLFLLCTIANDPSQNVFWKINNSDPYVALSFDRLHTFPGGLFWHHLWGRVKTHVEVLGRDVCAGIDKMYAPFLIFCCHTSLTIYDRADSVPCWRGLNHFRTYLAVNFTDGSKWEDMSKVHDC